MRSSGKSVHAITKPPPLIECKALAVSYGSKNILKDVGLSVSAGEIVSIIGPNGTGKTTLFRAIIGAVTPSSGNLIKAPGLSIGYVPQTLQLEGTLPLTVKRFMNLPRRQSTAEVDDALAQAGVSGLNNQQVITLSGGQFQRVLLARALLGRPALLLLDEATRGLDYRGTSDFYRQIHRVRENLGCAVMMISHELHAVMRQTDRVICLNGHICCEGKPEVVSKSPEYTALFGLDHGDDAAIYLHQGERTLSTKDEVTHVG